MTMGHMMAHTLKPSPKFRITNKNLVELITSNRFKYFSIWISHNKFSKNDMKTEHKIGCVWDSFTQDSMMIQNHIFNLIIQVMVIKS